MNDAHLRMSTCTLARLLMLGDDDAFTVRGAEAYYDAHLAPLASAESAPAECMVYVQLYKVLHRGYALVLDEASQVDWRFFRWLRKLCELVRVDGAFRFASKRFYGLRVFVVGNAPQLPPMQTGADWQSSPFGTEELPSALFTHSSDVQALPCVHLTVPLRLFAFVPVDASHTLEDARCDDVASICRWRAACRAAREAAQFLDEARWGVLTDHVDGCIFRCHERYFTLDDARLRRLHRYPQSLADLAGEDAAFLGLSASNDDAQEHAVARLNMVVRDASLGPALVLPALDEHGFPSSFGPEQRAALARVVFFAGVFIPGCLYLVGEGFAKIRPKIGQTHDKEKKPGSKELVRLMKTEVDGADAPSPNAAGFVVDPPRFKLIVRFVERENQPCVILKEKDRVRITAPLSRARDAARGVVEAVACAVPLMPASDMTIMQAEGREARNVLLHLDRVGYFGQFFVGASRQTAWEGLFMAGWCDYDSWMKQTTWKAGFPAEVRQERIRVHPEAVEDGVRHGLVKSGALAERAYNAWAAPLLAKWRSDATFAGYADGEGAPLLQLGWDGRAQRNGGHDDAEEGDDDELGGDGDDGDDIERGGGYGADDYRRNGGGSRRDWGSASRAACATRTTDAATHNSVRPPAAFSTPPRPAAHASGRVGSGSANASGSAHASQRSCASSSAWDQGRSAQSVPACARAAVAGGAGSSRHPPTPNGPVDPLSLL